MDTLTWSPHMALGIPEVDAAHAAFLLELARLRDTPDAAFGAGLDALVASMERDFREEEALMEAIGFSGLPLHREQHARVLGTLHRVIPLALQGNCAEARSVIALIAPWFMLHVKTMDAAMAMALELASDPDAGAPAPSG